MEKIKRILYRCSEGVGVISAIGYLAIVAICVLDVALEKIFGKPIQGSYELVERCMVIAVFTSFAYAQTKKAHINMMILIERFPRLLRLLLLGLTSLLSIATTAYAAYAAWTQGVTTLKMNQITGILHIPLWPFYIVQSIAMFFFALILLLDTIYVFRAIKNDKLNELVTEDYGMIIPQPKDVNGLNTK